MLFKNTRFIWQNVWIPVSQIQIIMITLWISDAGRTGESKSKEGIMENHIDIHESEILALAPTHCKMFSSLTRYNL
jgi:hypothetical protein